MDAIDRLLLGLAAGDSLGATSEFASRHSIPSIYERNRHDGWPLRQVGGGGFGWRRGQPTDDTEMALCLHRSFKTLGHFDGADVGRRFVAWMHSGPKDIGGTTSRTLAAIARGTPWYEGALADYRGNPDNAANGSLMRNGVVPGMTTDLGEVYAISIKHGLMTHFAPLPAICCAAQSYLIWAQLRDPGRMDGTWPTAFRDAFNGWLRETRDEQVLSWRRTVAARLPGAFETFLSADWNPHSFNPFESDFSIGQGYCLLTLQIAVWALHWSLTADPFPVPDGFPAEVFQQRGPNVLGWVAMVGYDSDTYGATAGPLIAAAHEALPQGLTDGLWVSRELAGQPLTPDCAPYSNEAELVDVPVAGANPGDGTRKIRPMDGVQGTFDFDGRNDAMLDQAPF
ncbi:MAG TPA: ADP-ribosylglycohydrolase family protein [Planctomycetota bacterium]|jgi:ADP-ribosylglycohydrolase